jgi:hypothetical protein
VVYSIIFIIIPHSQYKYYSTNEQGLSRIILSIITISIFNIRLIKYLSFGTIHPPTLLPREGDSLPLYLLFLYMGTDP